ALRARAELGPAVASALERNGQGHLGELLDFRQGHFERLSHPAAEPDRPLFSRRDEGNVEMDQQIVQARRRQIVAQGLERQAGIAVGESHLLTLEVALDMWALLGMEE